MGKKKDGLSGHDKVVADRERRAKDRKAFPEKGGAKAKPPKPDTYRKVKAAHRHIQEQTAAVEADIVAKIEEKVAMTQPKEQNPDTIVLRGLARTSTEAVHAVCIELTAQQRHLLQAIPRKDLLRRPSHRRTEKPAAHTK